ncbi:minor tail protein [Arthrobacter phage Nubia]|uniref:Minor tail protein n=1 Tax=Arthrobacter phage Nubia TaxID=2015865 RepID=A0A222ZH56_9CAUD|nr:minor tail protein [Arthrobacter phage Nubia]ASR83735.1 hypothetical protein SEA_NUBIA_1 [Arthrobacter phage Nubia]
MTIVNFGLRHPGAAGRVQATGRVAWIPTERKIDGSLVVLPSRVSVTLTPEASAEIEPGVYLFHEEAVGGISAYRIVPNAIEVEYASLVAVDPTTLDPEAQPEAAWYAFVESLNASNADMLASALSAQHSAELAQLSATGSQTSAAASAQLSAGSALDSQASANASANSATQAGTARDGAVSAQASAAGYASAASGYAGEAQDSADEAAVQAGLALTRAGTATDKAAEATAAVLGFGIGTVSTVGPSVPASATVTGPVGNRVLNLTLPRGATPVFSVLETTTGPETPGATGMPGQKGDTGAPGGFVASSGLASTDLNTVLTAGLYTQSTAANGTLALNYPVDIVAGQLLVTRDTVGNFTTQIFYPYNGAYSGKVFWWRRYNAAWSAWAAVGATRTDQTAGRAMYAWDNVNNRDQLIYGNTGFRDISALLAGGTGTLHLQREGNTVHLHGRSITGADTNLGIRMALNASQIQGHYPAATIRGVGHAFDNTWKIIEMLSNGELRIYSSDAVQSSLNFTLSWNTVSPWPTSLVGTAVNTIPNL